MAKFFSRIYQIIRAIAILLNGNDLQIRSGVLTTKRSREYTDMFQLELQILYGKAFSRINLEVISLAQTEEVTG